MRNLLIVVLAVALTLSLVKNAHQRRRIRDLKEQVSLIKAQDEQNVAGVQRLEGTLTALRRR